MKNLALFMTAIVGISFSYLPEARAGGQCSKPGGICGGNERNKSTRAKVADMEKMPQAPGKHRRTPSKTHDGEIETSENSTRLTHSKNTDNEEEASENTTSSHGGESESIVTPSSHHEAQDGKTEYKTITDGSGKTRKITTLRKGKVVHEELYNKEGNLVTETRHNDTHEIETFYPTDGKYPPSITVKDKKTGETYSPDTDEPSASK